MQSKQQQLQFINCIRKIILLTVANNSTCFNAAAIKKENGFENIKARVKKLTRHVQYTAAPAAGTKIEVSKPSAVARSCRWQKMGMKIIEL